MGLKEKNTSALWRFIECFRHEMTTLWVSKLSGEKTAHSNEQCFWRKGPTASIGFTKEMVSHTRLTRSIINQYVLAINI